MYVDLTTPGKQCGLISVVNQTAGLQCWIGLGLTYGCAQINNFNAIYDQKACGAACATVPPGSPNNLPPPTCALNKCLQCDENKGDPTYKQWGGRSRRDTGLQSEIIRPCTSVAYLPIHDPCVTKTTSIPVAPTLTPSSFPTSEPSLTPTSEPSNIPTQKPSLTPTSEPSNIPTKKPSAIPTKKPSAIPTKTPSRKPSKKPTYKPTKKPLYKYPTKKPIQKPKETETGKKPSRKPVKQVTNKPAKFKQEVGESSESTDSTQGLPIGSIVGITVGAFTLLVGAICGYIWYTSRQKRLRNDTIMSLSNNINDDAQSMSSRLTKST